MIPRDQLSNGAYILVETLVSMAILSITMMMVQGAMRQAAITRGQAEDYSIAGMLLSNKMAALELTPRLSQGTESGVFAEFEGRFQFDVSITPLAAPIPQLPTGTPMRLGEEVREQCRAVMGHIELEVTWRRAGQDFKVVGETLILPEQFVSQESAL